MFDRSIVPMIESLNWDIFDFEQVREQTNFYGLLPDYILTDSHGKIVLVEVKPTYAYRQLEKDLKKYVDNSNVREKAHVVFLTTFERSVIYALGKGKGIRNSIRLLCSDYIRQFDTLWTFLSNSEEGFKTRIYEKALAPR